MAAVQTTATSMDGVNQEDMYYTSQDKPVTAGKVQKVFNKSQAAALI